MTEQYHPLITEQAMDCARKLFPQWNGGRPLVCDEIGDGNLNLVFRIREPGAPTGLIIKQALPYAKVVGESWPLTLDRARIEYEALQVQGGLCPGLAPKLYGHDPVLAWTAMEDLSDHHIMRRGLMERRTYPRFAEDISEFLSRTLFFTSDLGMNQQEKKRRVERFINPELCKITEDLIFDHPYADIDTNDYDPSIVDEVRRIWADRSLHLEVAYLREGFLTRAQALLHGDLHTGSLFVTENSTKVIDPEFAFYGPMGFDIGAVIANLLLNWAAQEGWSPDAESRAAYRGYLTELVQDIWRKFERKFLRRWEEHGTDRLLNTPEYRRAYLDRLLQDTVGYAGCKMIRRIIGLAHVADIDQIEQADARLRARRIALQAGRGLILAHRRIGGMAEALNLVQESLSAAEGGPERS